MAIQNQLSSPRKFGRNGTYTHIQAACELAIEQTQGDEIKKSLINHTFVENGVRWIIDYKTANIAKDANQETLREIAEQCRPQLENYQQLMAGYRRENKGEEVQIKSGVFLVRIGKLVVLD